MVSTKLFSIIILVSLMLSIAPITTYTYNAQDNMYKIDQQLRRLIGSGEYVEAVIILKDLDYNELLEIKLRNGPDAVKRALKSHAYTTQAMVKQYIGSLGGEVLNSFWIINALVVRINADRLVDIAGLSIVDRIVPNFEVYIDEAVKEYDYNVSGKVWSWGINRTRAPEVWEMGYNGSGVRICTIDTGVDISHPALAGKMLTLDPSNPYYPGGWMAFDSAGNPMLMEPMDTHGHGTHVSGTALGGDGKDIVIGVSPGATLMHALALPYGRGTFAQTLAAVEWAADPFYIDPDTGEKVYTGLPAHVVSMSWGARNYYGAEYLEPIRHMLLMNIIPVAAIGNGGYGTHDNPGNIYGVFAIGAINEYDQVASFSGGAIIYWPYIPPSWPFNNTYPSRYIKPDFTAPGVRIVSSMPGGGYAALSGTSMATPHVAGIIALMYQATGWYRYGVPDIPEKFYEILRETALDLGDPGQDPRYGWGIVDAYEAVRKALELAKISGVKGFVYDAETGEPLNLVNVYAYNDDGELVGYAKTNASGYYILPLDPGTYTIVYNRFGYENYSVTVDVVIYNGTIVGHITDRVTSTPIPNAEVTILELGITVPTDVNGYYQVSVPPGRYTVKAEAPDYFSDTKSVIVGEQELVILDFQLYHESMQAILKVHAVDYFTGEPIAKANVSLRDTGKWALTDNNGTAIISGIPPGTYTVLISKPYYALRVYEVTLEPGEHTLDVDTTYKIAIMSHDPDQFGEDIRQALVAMGYPSYAIDVLGPMSTGNLYKVMIVNMFGQDPGEDELLSLLHELDSENTSIIFLDAWGSYYYFAGYTMYKHGEAVNEQGYPAPAYRSDGYIQGLMLNALNTSHPLFHGIEFDEGTAFYIASTPADRVDYAVYTGFHDPANGSLVYLGELIKGGTVYGYSIVVWERPYEDDKWIFLSIGGSYHWAKYMEKGQDMQYSENMRKLLVNAISYLIGIEIPLDRSSFKTRSGVKGLGGIGALAFTMVKVYLNRLPYGWVDGTVYAGDTGEPLANSKIVVKDTIVSTTTNESGYYRIWLPQGTYTIVYSSPGYYSLEKTITIIVNGTITVDVELLRAPRAAVMFDFSGQLSTYLLSRGWYARGYRDWDKVINDLGFYDVLILAGEYVGTCELWPDRDTFEKLINKTYDLGIGIVFMNNYFEYRYIKEYPYGINLLYYYFRNPRSIASSYDQGPVFYQVIKEHPILEGYNVGERIYIVEGGDFDYAWFSKWDGDLIAHIGAEMVGVRGGGIGVKITEAGTRWVLLAGLAPEVWTNMDHWTDDAKEIFYRSVVWASVKYVSIDVAPSEVYVGDTLEITIPPLPGVTFSILLDNTVILSDIQGSDEQMTIEWTVSLLEYGVHRIVLISEGMYYGEKEFFVKTHIVPDKDVVYQESRLMLNITGHPVNETLHIYIDDNYMTTIYARSIEPTIVVINIPSYFEEGEHVISLRRTCGEILGTATVTIKESMYKEYMTTSIDRLNESLATGLEQVLVNLFNIKENITLLSLNMTHVIDKLRQEIMSTLLNEIISEIRQLGSNISLNTGSIIERIEEIPLAINSSESRIINEMRSGHGGIESKLTKLSELDKLTKLDDVLNSLTSISDSIDSLNTGMDKISSSIDETKDTQGSIVSLQYVIVLLVIILLILHGYQMFKKK